MELIIVLILSFICVLLWISPSSRKAEPITVGVQTEEENKKDIGVQTDQTDPRAINFRLPVQAIEYQKLAPRRKPMKFADDYDPCEGTSRNQNLFNHEANSEDNNTVDGGQTRSRSSKRRNTDYDPQEGSSGSKTRMTRSTENVPTPPPSQATFPFEILESRRGYPELRINGELFTIKRKNKDTIIWACGKRCGVTAKTRRDFKNFDARATISGTHYHGDEPLIKSQLLSKRRGSSKKKKE